jgi:hypothetical protein
MNCCICGTVRNCETYLKKIFINIEKIVSLFDDYKIIIYYDESTDNTLKILTEYQKVKPKLFLYVNKEPLSEYRTFRIAKGRNMCLNFIRKNQTKFPYFIMMDMDCVNSHGQVNIEPIKRVLDRDDWDAVSFNKPTYYDIWALSIKPFYLSCAHIGDSAGNAMSKYIINILNNAKKDDLIECASAFGGFAIYRTNKFLNCYYYGGLNLSLIPQHLVKQNIALFKGQFNYNKIEDCEHRYFHFMAINKNQARIRISPEILFLEDNIW